MGGKGKGFKLGWKECEGFPWSENNKGCPDLDLLYNIINFILLSQRASVEHWMEYVAIELNLKNK